MTEVGVHEAKTHLSQLLRRVMMGEEVVIRRGKEPVAKLVPMPHTGRRQLGTARGWTLPHDLEEPMSEEELAEWYDAPLSTADE